ncbi:MAG: transposase [Desulfobacterales bacterium]|jgi:REP element-mobilizing transposase RayT
MPRSARIDAPGVLHHIIIRGMNNRVIFTDDSDRDNLLERLAALLPETRTACYAWAFLPDHAHFLMRSGPEGISRLMQRLLTGYARSFNRRHRRKGALFQQRYKSFVCQEDVYFKELVRYIHLNPVRRNLTKDIEASNTFPYSGHATLMGKHARPWQNTRFVLSGFGKGIPESRQQYLAYVVAGLGHHRETELSGGGIVRSAGGWAKVKKLRDNGNSHLKGDERILGDGRFVEVILAKTNGNLNGNHHPKPNGAEFRKVEQQVVERFGIQRDLIYARGRRRAQVDARSLLCYLAVRDLGYSRTDLAKRLGMTQPAVGYAVDRGKQIAKKIEKRQ